jgi:HAD superfamily hydrolase (TIGR01509 family)
MIQGIKHIIFDLGGVLLNIDYKATETAFLELGIPDFSTHYSQLQQNDFFNDLETGRISRADFIKGMQDVAPQLQLSEEQIVKAWNAMLLDFPIRRLQLLQQLRLYYDLVLLSNTNEIHEAAFNAILMAEHTIPALGAFFDRIYFSHRVGMRKPDQEIFERILAENEFKPEQTLFIDDSPQHIETAKQLGIQTIYLTDGMKQLLENIFGGFDLNSSQKNICIFQQRK